MRLNSYLRLQNKKMKENAKGFIEFIKKQNVMTLAIGFMLGSAVSKVVSSIVVDIINPILGIILGSTNGLQNFAIKIGTNQIMIGKFIANLVDFIIIALIVYYGTKTIGLEKTTVSEKQEKK